MLHSIRFCRRAVAFAIGILCCISFATAEMTSPKSKVVSLYPAPGDKNACIDATLRIKFEKTPTFGAAGKLELIDAEDNKVVDWVDLDLAVAAKQPSTQPSFMEEGTASPPFRKQIGGRSFFYYPVVVSGNEAVVSFQSNVLKYGKSYYVKIDAGFFKDESGGYSAISDPKEWSFTTRAAGPAAGASRITVATDSSGDFNTVQAAVDSVPDSNNKPVTIFLKKGTYFEIVAFANKNALTFLGEDRKETVIAYANNNGFAGGGGGGRGVFNASRTTDMVLANLTMRNLTRLSGSQAETIILGGGPAAQTIITNCEFYSTQDTIQINGQAYLSNCYIEGTVDFMWGSGPCFFENCQARALRTPGYYAQVRNRGEDSHGYVYFKCIFDGAEGVTRNVFNRILPSAYPDCEVAIIDCEMTSAVATRGWLLDRNETNPQRIRFLEYNSHHADGTPADLSERIKESKILKMPDDAQTIANYSNPTWVLGGQWTPKLSPIIASAPADAQVTAGQSVTLAVQAVAVPAPKYQWQKDGKDIADVTSPTYTIEHATASNAGKYTVTVSNADGTVTTEPAVLKVGS